MGKRSDSKITVGIVTYNRPEFLKEAVASVLQQSFANFELIISNDYQEAAVTFESLGIERDPRVKIINQNPNLGEVRNMNHLLEVAQGEWFVWLCDDDLLHPEFLKLASQALLERQESGVVGFFSNYLAASSPVGAFSSVLKSGKWSCYDASNFLLDYSSRKISLIGCYGIMHLATLKKIGGILQLGNSFAPYSDTLIPILLVEFGKICWLDEPLVFLRTHEESLTCKSDEFSAYTTAEKDFLEKLRYVCTSKNVNIKPDKVVANMVRWFAKDEWTVLCRLISRGLYTVSILFVKYQIKTNLPRLACKHRISHILFVLGILGRGLFFGYYFRLRALVKGIQS